MKEVMTMKLQKHLSLLLTVLLTLTLLTGCGGSSNYAKTEEAIMQAPGAAPMEDYAMAETYAAMDMANGTTLNSKSESGSTTLPEGRKWIITVHMSAETEDLDAVTESLDQSINALGGYVEDQRIYNGSASRSRRYRYADLTIRIPAADVNKFTSEVAGYANVVSQETSRDDITLRYVATASRVTALETEQARLLELLAKAENMTDLLEIEARLTDVRYELENHASQLQLYDNQVDYATIYLNIEEVTEYTPVEPTLWERISGGFTSNLRGLGEGALDFIVWLITSSPYLVTYAIILTVAVILIKRHRKMHPAKKWFRKKDKSQE